MHFAVSDRGIQAIPAPQFENSRHFSTKNDFLYLYPSFIDLVLGHLLKWEYQPEKRSRSWFLTIREQRRAINRHWLRKPSLKARIVEALEDGFEAGVDLALRETDLPLRTFPENSSYEFEELILDSFVCDTSQDWEG